jgi:hypothetical protein
VQQRGKLNQTKWTNNDTFTRHSTLRCSSNLTIVRICMICKEARHGSCSEVVEQISTQKKNQPLTCANRRDLHLLAGQLFGLR